jgi:hypothetical protein
MSTATVIKRELRVAFSRRGQPVWFRLLKWTVFISLSAALWNTPYFQAWIAGVLVTGLIIHAIWRWKTNVWTRPWGGWNDLDAGRD